MTNTSPFDPLLLVSGKKIKNFTLISSSSTNLIQPSKMSKEISPESWISKKA